MQTVDKEAHPEYGVIVVGQASYFSYVKTFSWHPVAARAFIEDDDLSKNAIGQYKKAIETEMTSKGYVLVEQSQSDVIVSFGLAQESQLNDEVIYKGTQLSTGVKAFYVDDKEAQKGTVYIAFFGRDLSRPDWEVLVQGAIRPNANKTSNERRTNEVVSLMLRKVPEAN